MRILIPILTFSVFLFFSCKKEKLKGDSEILVGKWNWVYSSEVNNTCNPPTWVDTLNPDNQNASFSIEFLQKGKIIYYKNIQKTNEFKITSISFSNNPSISSNYDYSFTMYLDDKLELYGLVNSDSLLLNEGYPFPDTDCENYSNYFVRE